MIAQQPASLPSAIMSPNLRKIPLYDTLFAKLTEKVQQGQVSITPEYVSKLCVVLNSLDPERSTQVALLIIHFYFVNSTDHNNPFTAINCNQKASRHHGAMPFDIRTSSSGKGFSFDVNKLPPMFQALLGVYCRLI